MNNYQMILVGSDLGWNLFSVKQASSNGIEPIFGKHNLRLKGKIFTLENEVYFCFTLPAGAACRCSQFKRARL